MGKGISVAKRGTHIAFTAGTGLLVFIDLAAFILRVNLGLEGKEVLDSTFKFIFYVSFP
jgi:hypothetical protein